MHNPDTALDLPEAAAPRRPYADGGPRPPLPGGRGPPQGSGDRGRGYFDRVVRVTPVKSCAAARLK